MVQFYLEIHLSQELWDRRPCRLVLRRLMSSAIRPSTYTIPKYPDEVEQTPLIRSPRLSLKLHEGTFISSVLF